eukprot:362587-Prorocentrum_minimum.AAC.1
MRHRHRRVDCLLRPYQATLSLSREFNSPHRLFRDAVSLRRTLPRGVSSPPESAFRFQTGRVSRYIRGFRVIHLRHVPNSRVPLP